MGEEREELRALIAKLVSLDYQENDEIALLDRVNYLSPNPEWSDYIFYSKEFATAGGGIDIERLMDKIFSYRPIVL